MTLERVGELLEDAVAALQGIEHDTARIARALERQPQPAALVGDLPQPTGLEEPDD